MLPWHPHACDHYGFSVCNSLFTSVVFCVFTHHLLVFCQRTHTPTSCTSSVHDRHVSAMYYTHIGCNFYLSPLTLPPPSPPFPSPTLILYFLSPSLPLPSPFSPPPLSLPSPPLSLPSPPLSLLSPSPPLSLPFRLPLKQLMKPLR